MRPSVATFRHFAIVASLMLTLSNCRAAAVLDETTAPPLPRNSIYQLPIKLTDQDGHGFRLADKRGKPVIVSMFYNSCQFVCPMLIDTVRLTEDSLTQAQRDKLAIMLITFDPARDSVAVLKGIAAKRRLDNQWTLARTDGAAVRKLAALLGIQYRLLDNGDFNHSTVLVLLDDQGRIIGSTSQIGDVDPQFLKLVQKATN